MHSGIFWCTILAIVHRTDSQDRQFTITATPPLESNLVQVVPATSYLELLAGVPYPNSIITASSSFFVAQAAQVNAKLVFANETQCSGATVSLLGAPFDGASRPTQMNQLYTKWGTSRFDSAGDYTLCYSVAGAFTVLPLDIHVKGVVGTSHKIFCMFSNRLSCKARLPGLDMPGVSKARLGLVAFSTGTCGSSVLTSPFSRAISLPSVTTTTYEVHDMGLITGSAAVSSYKACYCPGYQARVTSPEVCTELTGNFVQTIGALILVSISVVNPQDGNPAVIFPRSKVNLSIVCGTGGCSSTSSPRMRIVDTSSANFVPYYDESGGCRAALQTSRYIGPANCDLTSATSCSLIRSDSPADGRKVTFNNVQVDGELVNGIRVSKIFDVCFCDAGCTFSNNWFLAGSIQVQRLTVQFTSGGVAISRPRVNLKGSIEISGSAAGSFRTSGALAREMKILSDPLGAVGSNECSTYEQLSTLVAGHDCYSVSNCAVPAASTNVMQSYGGDGISILQAGWIAVCYCDSECSTNSNWIVVGRILVAGPASGQQWTAKSYLPFALTLRGSGFTDHDFVSVVPRSSTCGSANAVQPNSVKGPTLAGKTLGGTNIAKIEQAMTSVFGGHGSLVYFGQLQGQSVVGEPHGLTDGDLVELSGIQTTGTTDSTVDMMFNNFHTVTVVDASTVLISVDFLAGAYPTGFTLGSASWRRSSLAIFEPIFVLEPGQYSVCWTPTNNPTGPLDYVARAGNLVVSAPTTFTGSLGLSSVKPQVSSPVVLQFTTSHSTRFTDLTQAGGMRLKIIFSSLSLLTPLDSRGLSLVVNALPTSAAGATLDVCGLLFKELSAAGSQFPHPSGCYFHNDVSGGSPRYEFVMVFTDLNFLAPSETYSIVMFGQTSVGLTPVNPLRGPVELWLMGPMDNDVIEIFLMKPNRAVVTPTGAALDAAFTVVSNGVGPVELKGFCSDSGPDDAHKCIPCSVESDCGNTNPNLTWCTSPISSACAGGNPSNFPSLQFRLEVNSGQISPASQVRLMLFPATVWNVQLSLVVTCTSNTQGKSCGSGLVSAVAENIVTGEVTGGNANVLRLILPSDMDLIVPGVIYTYSISSLKLPGYGFYPNYIFAEIVGPDGTSDLALLKSSVTFYITPRIASAALVVSDGNQKPFKGDQNNVLYLKTNLGFDLTGAGSSVTIQMPPGYSCREETVLNCNSGSACLHDGVTPKSLSVFENVIPSGRGIVGIRTQAAEDKVAAWSKDAGLPACVLTLKTSTTFWADSSFFFALNLDNPTSALQRTAATNKWTLLVSSGGLSAVPFTLAAPTDTHYGSNVAVVGKLARATVAPVLFGKGVSNEVLVFFQTENRCTNGTNAVVTVEAPMGFDFGRTCLLDSLEADYLVQETSDGITTSPLPYGACSGISTSEGSFVYNKAVIRTTASLEAPTLYAFRIRVRNPSTFPADPKWRIATMSSDGNFCDATYSPTSVKMNPDDPSGTSWEISERDLFTPTITLADMRPTGVATSVTIFPIKVSTANNFELKITAPAGYIWDFSAADLKFKSILDGGVEADSISGATASLPVAAVPTAPLAAPLNVLTIDYLESPLVVGKLYGLQAKVIVPRTTPTGSANQFYVQVGNKAESVAVTAPSVRSLTHGLVRYSTSIAGRTGNQICFQVKTITPIPPGGTLVITAPSGFVLSARCVLRPWNLDLSSMLPNDVTCYTTAGPSVNILAGKTSIPNSMYRFCTDANNPSTPTVGGPPTWEFKSFAVASVTTEYLDYPSVVSGFSIKAQMVGGYVSSQRKIAACKSLTSIGCSAFELSYWRTGRDDRPGHANQILFEFTPMVAGPTPSILVIKASEGFIFAHECVVVVNKATVLGEGVSVPLTYATWPANAIQSCTGSSNSATVILANPLTAGLTYLLRLSVLTNPLVTPLSNFWTIEYNKESTLPSAGFTVWAFTDPFVESTNQAAGESNVLVEISFAPLNTIPSSGFIVVSAPSGFVVPTVCTATVTGGVTALCAGTPTPSNKFTVTIAGSTSLQADNSYTISVRVSNPQVVLDARPWTITSYESSQESGMLDSSIIDGFPIVEKLSDFKIQTFSTVTGLDPVTFTLSFKLSTAALVGDLLTLTAPVGYLLNGKGRKTCTGYTVGVNADGVLPLQRNTPICVGNSLTWTFVQGTALLGANEQVVFSLTSVNPETTPLRNFFVLRHIRRSALLATWSLAAPALVPQLVSPSVSFGSPVMAGAGSTTSLTISFRTVSAANIVAIQGMNELANEQFILKNTVLLSGTGGARITGHPEQVVVIAGTFSAGSDVLLQLGNVVNTGSSGNSTWTITTYKDSSYSVMDQAQKVKGPTVLGKITIGGSSSVSPRTYGSLSSTMILALTSSVELSVGSTLVLTPASGYVFVSNSYQSVFGINAGMSGTNSLGQYEIVLAEPVRAFAEFSFMIQVNLPNTVQASRNWIVNAKNSVGSMIATNDGLFSGFSLISMLPFTIYPENSTPSASISVHISYTVPTAVVGINTVTMQITAPTGFVFASTTSCLARSVSQVWQACIATTNVATLVSSSRTIAAGAGSVDVLLTNPSVTPEVNSWQIVMFTDGDTSKYTNVDTGPGYSIKAMPVSYVGGNRLAAVTPGFFTFQLSAPIDTYFQVVIKPALGSGYSLSCTPGYQVGLDAKPVCSDSPGEVGAAITVTVPSEARNPSFIYTIGVSVRNPSLPALDNFFMITVLNPLGTTIDANVRVPSTELRAVLMSTSGFTFDTLLARSLTNVAFSLKVDSALSPGSDIIKVHIQAPDNFIVSASSSVKVSSALPLSPVAPIVVAGNTLTVTLDSSRTVEVGTYTIGFPVMNPSDVPINNVWVLTVYSGSRVLLRSPLEGYQFI